MKRKSRGRRLRRTCINMMVITSNNIRNGNPSKEEETERNKRVLAYARQEREIRVLPQARKTRERNKRVLAFARKTRERNKHMLGGKLNREKKREKPECHPSRKRTCQTPPLRFKPPRFPKEQPTQNPSSASSLPPPSPPPLPPPPPFNKHSPNSPSPTYRFPNLIYESYERIHHTSQRSISTGHGTPPRHLQEGGSMHTILKSCLVLIHDG